MFSLKRFFFSAGRPSFRKDGFTLIELVVVMALIGIMMFVTIPNFQHLLTDDMRETSQWILLQVPKFKAKAIAKNQQYELHADMENRRLWFSNSGMSDDEMRSAMEQGFQLSDSVQIVDVLYPDDESFNGGDALICFYPKGYSDKAVLHLEKDNGDRRSFLFEPFLTQIDMTEGYVDFED